KKKNQSMTSKAMAMMSRVSSARKSACRVDPASVFRCSSSSVVSLSSVTLNDSAATDAGDGVGTSTIVAEAVTGWHVLKVQGFSETKGLLGVGNCVCSGAFTVGGHKWHVLYYPDGIGHSDWISILIRFEDVSGHSKTTIISQFSGMCPTLGFLDYISRVTLKSSPYLYDDIFKIKCEITVYGDMHSKTTRPRYPWCHLLRAGPSLSMGRVGDRTGPPNSEVRIA
ncbi:hypothetical protein EJB05_26549, partial [Eragrostis curvula]